MNENKSKLNLTVSVKDTELFRVIMKYTEELIDILTEYPLSEVDQRRLNEISGEFFSIQQEVSE